MDVHRNSRLTNKGFSLVELIVVIAIMAVLAAVAIPTFAHFITQAKQASDIAFMHDLEYAIVLVAHAELKTGTISKLEVEINETDGSIVQITYWDAHSVSDPDGAPDQEVIRDEGYSFEAGDGQHLSEIIDWSYKFKAFDSVTDNKNWKRGQWSIVTTVIDPLDPME